MQRRDDARVGRAEIGDVCVVTLEKLRQHRVDAVFGYIVVFERLGETRACAVTHPLACQRFRHRGVPGIREHVIQRSVDIGCGVYQGAVQVEEVAPVFELRWQASRPRRCACSE